MDSEAKKIKDIILSLDNEIENYKQKLSEIKKADFSELEKIKKELEVA